jgi:hypothetical protein
MALYCDGMSADGSRAGGTNFSYAFSYPIRRATGFGNRRLEDRRAYRRGTATYFPATGRSLKQLT